MSIIRRLFQRRKVRQVADEGVKKLEEEEPERSVFLSLTPPMPPNPTPTPLPENFSVTGAYQTVKHLVDEAIVEKRKTKAAARRVSDTVGVTPSPLPLSRKASKGE